MQSDHPIMCFITAPNREEALQIGNALVEEKLAACVHLVPGLTSIYRWKGAICQDEEILLMAKSQYSQLNEIVRCVIEIHSYEVPEIVAIPIAGGSQAYLDWIKDSIR